uniref:Nuclear envelope phosphatase-regulatory subunit 1 n=14 Tax=Archelosauria TaxID=1329799 RepID=A0A8C5EXA8_9SAUR
MPNGERRCCGGRGIAEGAEGGTRSRLSGLRCERVRGAEEGAAVRSDRPPSPAMNSLEQAEVILIVVSVCTATGAWNWLIDPETQKVSFFTSLWNHPFFTISCITLIGLFFAGIHKRVVAPSIIAARCRTVLAEYNMSCDDTGKLILKPRPHVQ